MHSLTDEQQHPIQKATGFGSNMKWRNTALRCNGHRGHRRAHLQGRGPDGNLRTTTAAVYTRHPKGLEHTLVPGQCRHGKWAPGTNPRELARKAKEEAKKTPIELWKEAVHR